MKTLMKILLPILFVFLLTTCASAQCFTKCINSQLTASVDNDPTWTYNWSIAPAVAFTGQGTSSIDVASVGSIVGNFILSVTVTNSAGCSDVITNCYDVIDGTATLVLPLICLNSAGIPVSGGSPIGGVYEFNGNTITQFLPTMIGGNITYTSSVSGCAGSDSEILIGAPLPSTIITIN